MATDDSLGLKSGAVRVVAYDERWPAIFESESARLSEVCGPLPIRFEHIGSTSVPGLAAKPVLDILGGHPAGASPFDYVKPFEQAGYVHRGDRGIPGHQFFRRGDPRAYHIHLVDRGGKLWREYLAFRDHLRENPEEARRYAELKRALAKQFPRDRESYIEGKAPFVAAILREKRF